MGRLRQSTEEVQRILDEFQNKYGYSRIVGSKEQYFASKESAKQYDSNPIANASLLLGEVTIPSTGSGGGGSIDPELLEGYMPLVRDFSDDFNNDFTR